MTTKYKYGLIGIALILMLGNVVHAQTQTGYSVPARADVGGGRMTGDMWCQYGTNGVRFIFGTQTVTQVGTSGVMTGTIANGSPSLDISYGGGSTSANFDGFNAVYVAGSQVGTSGALTGKLDAVGGVGTNNTFNNPTFDGVGTITASFGANGLVISPAELSMVDGATIPLNTATGSITNHTHTGSDGTTQISHDNVTGTGANSHAILDNFVSSKAAASGVASLDANSLVVQNPANATNSPTASKIPISLGTGFLNDSWLSSVISKLGTDIQLGTETTGNTDNISEGSTNKYYTDARVNAAVGSLSVNALSDVIISSPANGQFLKYTGSEWINGTSSASVAFSAVTGSATSSQLPLISGLNGSATSAQLPTVLKLYGTTTTQAAGEFGQLYVQSSSSGGGNDEYTKLLLHMDNPGTSTFVDSSGSAHTVTAVGSAIGTATAKFESGSLYTSLNGDYLSVPDSEDKNFGSGDFTIDFWVYHNTAIGSTETYIGDTDTGSLAFFFSRWSTGVLTLYYGTNGPDWAANQPATTETLSSNTWHHIALVRNGATTYVFIDGVAATLSSNISGTIWNGTGVLNIGNYGANAADSKVKGYMDELRISKGIARWTTNFTPPAAPYNDQYTQYSAKYADPVNGNTVFDILTPGTATTRASYIYCNATTTVFGAGTNTAVTATSTPYSGWFDGAVRATAFNVASTEKIKENIKDIKIKPDMLDAEGIAKQNYIAGAKAAWIAAHQAEYETTVNETGTGSVTLVDLPAMESDYNNHIELEWASDLNQDVYTENIQKTYEKGFWQMFDTVQPRSWNPKDKPSLTRKGFVVEDMPDVVKGDDGQSIDPMALIAYISVVQQTLKADTIFALSTLKELITTGTVTQQKIDYCNDRLEVLNP